MRCAGYVAIIALLASPARAGEISAVGSIIEVQDIRCEVKSDYRIECINIGRVCEAHRAKDAVESKKTFGCALKDSPNYPCPPWEERTAQISEKTKRFGHCSPLLLGGF